MIAISVFMVRLLEIADRIGSIIQFRAENLNLDAFCVINHMATSDARRSRNVPCPLLEDAQLDDVAVGESPGVAGSQRDGIKQSEPWRMDLGGKDQDAKPPLPDRSLQNLEVQNPGIEEQIQHVPVEGHWAAETDRKLVMQDQRLIFDGTQV
jgi:hypothetical protein